MPNLWVQYYRPPANTTVLRLPEYWALQNAADKGIPSNSAQQGEKKNTNKSFKKRKKTNEMPFLSFVRTLGQINT